VRRRARREFIWRIWPCAAATAWQLWRAGVGDTKGRGVCAALLARRPSRPIAESWEASGCLDSCVRSSSLYLIASGLTTLGRARLDDKIVI